MSEVHSFSKDLAKSLAPETEAQLSLCYKAAFPNTTQTRELDVTAQKRSIDRWITDNQTGERESCEEKTRWPNKKTGKYYGDVLLEIWSSVEHGRPGWICKDRDCDWFLYILIQKKEAYKLTGKDLDSAWADNYKIWVKCMQVFDSPNAGYTTRSLGIPLGIFKKAVPSFEVITWK